MDVHWLIVAAIYLSGVISGGTEARRAARAGHSHRLRAAWLWIFAFCFVLSGWVLVLTSFPQRGLLTLGLWSVGLGALFYSLWLRHTLPIGERPSKPAA